MTRIGQLEKLLILMISTQKQAEVVELTSKEYKQYLKQVLNAWMAMTRTTIKTMKGQIQEADASDLLEKWAVYFIAALDEFSKAEDKAMLMKVLEEFNKGQVEFTDTDLQTTCVNFGKMCQKEPNKSPAWHWVTFKKHLQQKREEDSTVPKKGRPGKYQKYTDIKKAPKKRGKQPKVKEPETIRGTCRNCDNLRSEFRRDDIQPWCVKGKMKFKAAVRIDYESEQFQSGCSEFKPIPQAQ